MIVSHSLILSSAVQILYISLPKVQGSRSRLNSAILLHNTIKNESCSGADPGISERGGGGGGGRLYTVVVTFNTNGVEGD